MKNRIAAIVSIVAIVLMLPVPTYSGPTFTGNAPADFTAADVVIILDPGGVVDVGMPPGPPGVTGWETAALYFDYDHDTDIMYIGVDTVSICGDADGDGNPGAASAWLGGLGGQDLPNLQNTESFCLLIDPDNDYVPLSGGPGFEVVVGVDSVNDFTTFGAYNFVGNPFAPAGGFGAALPNIVTVFANPSAAAPDMEFSIASFSTLPGSTFTPGNAFSFQVMFFQGSLQDDGIGEDYIPGAGDASTVNIPPPAPQPPGIPPQPFPTPKPPVQTIQPLAHFRISQAKQILSEAEEICAHAAEKREDPAYDEFYRECCENKLDEIRNLIERAERYFEDGNYIAANYWALKAYTLLVEIGVCCGQHPVCPGISTPGDC
jgi:hypothetical protein